MKKKLFLIMLILAVFSIPVYAEMPDDTLEVLEEGLCSEGVPYEVDGSIALPSSYKSRNKKEIIESFLPIYVDKTDKNYWMMGNVTCAAAAASSNKMIRKEAFYEWMKD